MKKHSLLPYFFTIEAKKYILLKQNHTVIWDRTKNSAVLLFQIKNPNQYFCIAPSLDEPIILPERDLSFNEMSKSETPERTAQRPNRMELVETDEIFTEKSITAKTINTNGAMYMGMGITE